MVEAFLALIGILLSIVFVGFIVGYYVLISQDMYLDDAETKAQFWVTLLPFGRWVLNAIETYKELDK